MLGGSDSEESIARFDARFRLLLTATAGSGLIALAMIDVAANAWGDFGSDARALVAIAARTAYLEFLLIAVALIGAYLGAGVIRYRLETALNLFGAGTFLCGTFICGRLLSRALALESPAADAAPADVVTFLGVGGIALLALMAALLLTQTLRWLPDRGEAKVKRKESDAS